MLRNIQLTAPLKISSTFVLLVLLVGFGAIGAKAFIAGKIESTSAAIETLKTQRSVELERSILQIPSQVKFVTDKFNAHIYGTNIFEFIREHTTKASFIKQIGVDASQQALAIDMVAQTFNDAAKLIGHLKTLKEVSTIKVTNVRLLENGSVGFSINLSVLGSVLTAR